MVIMTMYDNKKSSDVIRIVLGKERSRALLNSVSQRKSDAFMTRLFISV